MGGKEAIVKASEYWSWQEKAVSLNAQREIAVLELRVLRNHVVSLERELNEAVMERNKLKAALDKVENDYRRLDRRYHDEKYPSVGAWFLAGMVISWWLFYLLKSWTGRCPW